MGTKIDKLKGRAMQIEGKLTGDRVRIAQGTAVKKKGELEGAASRVVREVKGKVRRAQDAVARAVRPKRG
jgi:uncharacterized protein YjbJ (UPF0337 family)